jgi:hypothetical protein
METNNTAEKTIWTHKDEWKRQGDTFCIVISRHEGTPIDFTEGIHRWAIYAYIYPKHPLFKEFDGEKMFQHATSILPLHWGCSFLRVHNNGKEITSYQVGCDYHHLHDSHYTHYRTKDDASEVFFDADELFDFLTNFKTKEPL